MNTDLNSIHGIMRNMVNRIKGLEAFAAAFEAFTGKPQSISTISRKMSGSAEWWVSDMLALQNALGVSSVTDYIEATSLPEGRARRFQRAVSILSHVKDMSRECSEAEIAAISAHFDPSPEARVTALREIAEAEASLKVLRQIIEEKGDNA